MGLARCVCLLYSNHFAGSRHLHLADFAPLVFAPHLVRVLAVDGCGQILWRIWGIWGILKNLLTVLLTDATLKEVMMYPRDIRVNDPSEALIVEQALAMYREMKQAADAAPDGTVFDTAESLAVARGRELMRRSLEIVLHDQAEGVEKKGLPAEPARVAARDITGVRGRARSSRRRVR